MVGSFYVRMNWFRFVIVEPLYPACQEKTLIRVKQITFFLPC